MEINDARILVAGATGEVGSRLAHELSEAGARVALAGRNEARLAELGDELEAPTLVFEATDPDSCAGAVDGAAKRLGGLDALVIATGVAAFGDAAELGDDTARTLFAVNALGPIALVRAALGHLPSDGAIVALSAIVADHPTAGMAAYSASKAALSGYLAAVRRERRRGGLTVLDARPQHMETGFSDRAIAGEPPPLPRPVDVDEVVAKVLDGMRNGRRELAYDLESRELVVS